VDELEKDRPGLSYTADTLAELQRRQPEAELFLMIGSDCLPDIPGWHEPARIVAAAGILVVERAGSPVWSAEGLRARLRLSPHEALFCQAIEMPLVDISSRDLRRRAADGRSVRYLVPRAVECYIQTHHLYALAGPAFAD
jgi:nicotinate-nucleotide adenylyltransferase